jgi:hypothetical protein
MRIPSFIIRLWFVEKLYRLKLVNAIRGVYFRWKIKRGLYVLESLDGWMDSAGYKRHERRQFWREFTARQGAREKLWERLKA